MRNTFFGCWASGEGAVISKTVIGNQKRDFAFIGLAPDYTDHRSLFTDNYYLTT
jgi:hypothetical protein